MSVETNPFADTTGDDPFSDPSISQVTHSKIEPVEDYNVISEHGGSAANTTSPYQPAVLQPSTVPSPQMVAQAAQTDLLRQQDELEKKAAELDRREKELQSRKSTGHQRQSLLVPPLRLQQQL